MSGLCVDCGPLIFVLCDQVVTSHGGSQTDNEYFAALVCHAINRMSVDWIVMIYYFRR